MQTRIVRCSLLFLLTVAGSRFLFSQNQTPVSDPEAVALASQAMVALTNGVAVSDVSLTGSATRIAGSDTETSPATLQAKGTGESRIDLNLSRGTRTEIRNDTAGFPQGESIGPDGTVQPWALHNCWINASWFFPALSILSAPSDSSMIFTYVGLERRDGGTVQHLRAYRYLSGQKADVTALTQNVSTEDIYLDSTSLLPVAFTFNAHPDDDAATNIALEIDFSNYRSVNGVQVPMRVQKLISGGLALDIVVKSVVVNSGLGDGPFAIQ